MTDVKRMKYLAGMQENVDYAANDMLAKLRDLPSNDQLNMIYQWVKTGHVNAGQFRTLIKIWMDHHLNPPARM